MRNRKFAISCLCLILSLVMTLSAFSGSLPLRVEAKSSSAIREEINGIKEEREKIWEERKTLGEQMADNMSQIEKKVAEKNVIDQEIGLLTQEIELITDEIQAYGLLIADKQDELDAAQAQLDKLTEENRERIRAMEENGNLSYWSVLFRANDFADLLDRLNMIDEIATADRRRLDSMRQAHEVVRVAQETLSQEKAAMETSRLELEEKQTTLAQKRVEADKKLAELKAKQDDFMELMAQAEAADNALMQEIAQLEKEYTAAKNAEEAAARPIVGVGQKPPPTVTNGITWVMPCAYLRLSSPYGYRTHPVTGAPGQWHDGVDLANYSGTPIVATRAGTVTIARFSTSAGYYVSINHGDGFASVYMHMTHFVVSVGEKVAAGQTIGYMGSTGMSTGPHLHFGLSYNGSSQNPADYLNFY